VKATKLSRRKAQRAACCAFFSDTQRCAQQNRSLRGVALYNTVENIDPNEQRPQALRFLTTRFAETQRQGHIYEMAWRVAGLAETTTRNL